MYICKTCSDTLVIFRPVKIIDRAIPRAFRSNQGVIRYEDEIVESKVGGEDICLECVRRAEIEYQIRKT